MTVAPGNLYYVLPREVCTSVKHVGDTVTTIVWRARQSVRDGMVGIAPDPAVPDSLVAMMRVVRVDADTDVSTSPIQFAVEGFALGSLRGSAPASNPAAEPPAMSSVNTRALVGIERCYPPGHSLVGTLADPLVLR